ncbi:LuxR C-terminal-related transcriptional regulator [Streptomyces sp. NPDC127084]|uniref:LuxR C-terminal-related transcriptional regulator n=1 Tax=Streptomyces sp. NPDC127084 TaxID=3347133 RepID=UPI0036553039
MRVVLAEDLFLLRDGLTRTLHDHGCQVVESVDNGPALARALSRTDLDVAVIDVRLPPTHTDEGLRAALQARSSRPALPVLILSHFVDQLYAHELLASGEGAVGYLLKDRVTHTAQFIDALRTVASGGTVMDPQVVAKLLTRSGKRGRTDSLTGREHEVLALMAEGRSNTAIAQTLHVSESAVAKHIASVFGKLRIEQSPEDNRRVLAVLAYLKG